MTDSPPFSYALADDVATAIMTPDTLEEAITVAIGMASMCWETPEGAGVFNSERAVAISHALLDLVRGYVR